MSKKLKQRIQKVIAGLSCVIFVQTTLFPFVAAAQVMAPAPMAVVPAMIPSNYIPLVIPSVLEKEKFVDVNKASFSFSRTDYVLLSWPSEKHDGLAYLSRQGTLPGYIGINTPRPRPQLHPRPVWDGITGGSSRVLGYRNICEVLGQCVFYEETPASPPKSGARGAKTAKTYVAERFHLRTHGAHRRKPKPVFG